MSHVLQAVPKLPQAAAALESVVRFVSKHTGWGRASEDSAPTYGRRAFRVATVGRPQQAQAA
jgi:hypothetical protein